ncbi:MAG: DUF488 domain-containing protein [Candidatus Latescibacter sp.]|nr:DUF488 domain-containing protein [Candidatus Latescibacter sp.]
MKLYTIGFTQKHAELFFGLLRQNSVQRLVDIRLNAVGQLSGFAKKDDLPFFLSKLVDGCQYIHLPELTPTKEILNEYRSDSDWSRFVARFEALMDERKIPDTLDKVGFERFTSCLLCSEPTPEQCHRRLVAERLTAHWPNVEVFHL